MSSVCISSVSIRPATSRAQIRAQIWFLSCKSAVFGTRFADAQRLAERCRRESLRYLTPSGT
jgi:hypothetical protein